MNHDTRVSRCHSCWNKVIHKAWNLSQVIMNLDLDVPQLNHGIKVGSGPSCFTKIIHKARKLGQISLNLNLDAQGES